MAVHVLVALTGQYLPIDLTDISSLQTLKEWIQDHGDIPAECQVLMTASGRNVKQQHLSDENEIFVYDKRILASESWDSPPDPSPAVSDELVDKFVDAPAQFDDEADLASCRNLFKERAEWASTGLRKAQILHERVVQVSDTCEIIDRSTTVALANLRNHVVNIRQNYESSRERLTEVERDHEDVFQDWQRALSKLGKLRVRRDIALLLKTARACPAQDATILRLIDVDQLERLLQQAQNADTANHISIQEVAVMIQKLEADTNVAAEMTAIEWPDHDIQAEIQEIETLTEQMLADCQEVHSTLDDEKSMSRIARLATTHTNDYIPSIQAALQISEEALDRVHNHLKNLRKNSHMVLRRISSIQSELAISHQALLRLTPSNVNQTDMLAIQQAVRLPATYGSVLIEAVRRTEWSERTTRDVRIVEEDLNQHRTEELQRRRKWLSTIKDHLNDESADPSSFASLGFSEASKPWPSVTRDEVFKFIDDLRALDLDDDVERMTQMFGALESVHKVHRSQNAFAKSDTVHRSMRDSFLRGQEESRALQEDKQRLEEKLRASESRIRKLEDMVHRHDQSIRPTIGGFSPFPELHRALDTNGANDYKPADSSLSRRSSTSARRTSGQQGEHESMARRIVVLEAHLARLQQEVESERQSSTENREKMLEAEGIKRDLTANFDSQRQEFLDDRVKLEDESHELKVKIEELEEEIDRIIGSRDHEYTKQEQTITHVRSELQRSRKSANEEVESVRRAKEVLESNLAAQAEKLSRLEAQAQSYKESETRLQAEYEQSLQRITELEAKQSYTVHALRTTYSHLSPADSAPDDIDHLVNALTVLAEEATVHTRNLDNALQLAHAHTKTNESKIAGLEEEIQRRQVSAQRQQEQIRTKDLRINQLSDSYNEVQAVRDAQIKEVADLRREIAIGETGSDTLRARLREAETGMKEIVSTKTKDDARMNDLQAKLSAKDAMLEDAQAMKHALQSKLESRAAKARDLSEKVFQHNDRTIRMLENFGYSVLREGEGLTVQRTSKVGASTILGGESAVVMRRTVSGAIPVQHYSDPSDLERLDWLSSEDSSNEDADYEAFLKVLSRLDVDAVMEMVTKRYKDIEALAKKYQKDSRTIKERFQRLQSDAHEKIAYRSFKEGDLALFLPTRNQVTRPWAAFNIGAPHYFLREQDTHRLQSREWLLARIQKIEERVVDLSRSVGNVKMHASTSAHDGTSTDDENPFELSDGLRWYMLDAVEEKPGAPSTPGLGKSTVAASVIEAQAQMGSTKVLPMKAAGTSAIHVAKTLHKSLDSRRSSEASRKSGIAPMRPSVSNSSTVAATTSTGTDGQATGQMSPHVNVRPSDADTRANASGQAREDAKVFEVAEQSLENTNRSHGAVKGRQSSISPQKLRNLTNRTPDKAWDKLFSFQYQT